MATYPHRKEIILPIRTPYPFVEESTADEDVAEGDVFATAEDRLTPGVAGGIMGVVAGAAALGLIHAFSPAALAQPVSTASEAWRVDGSVGFAIAYVTAASLGSIGGMVFGVVTRNLRKWAALALWGLVFFVSLTMVVLAFALHGRLESSLSAVVLLASAAYGFVLSLALPLRRRR
jgi:hypothetical protein